ncbi:hypothetical protein J2T18_002751 [Paenibacillus polymyxa]|nr:hypothetical protein [Paenibacillus polymyxa]
MRIIKTQQDLTTLHSASLFPSLLPHIQNHFNQLHDEIGDAGDRLFVRTDTAILSFWSR